MRYLIKNNFSSELKRGFGGKTIIFCGEEVSFILQSRFAILRKKFQLIDKYGECVSVLRRGMFSVFSKWRIETAEKRFCLKWKGKLTQDVYLAEVAEMRIESILGSRLRAYRLTEKAEETARLEYGKEYIQIDAENIEHLCALLSVSVCTDW